MTRPRLFLALAATAFVFTSATAWANETQWYSHATVCTAQTGSSASAFYNQYGVNNTSTTTALTVECPLITTLGNSVLMVREVRVGLFDRGATRLTCTLKSIGFDGTVVYSQINTTSSGGLNTNSQILDFSVPAGHLQDNFWELECTIPAVNSGQFSAVTAMEIAAS